MSSINEALVLDKVQLKKLVLQLEQENDVLSAKVDKMERAKISDQEKLNLCERTNEELCTEKGHLEQLLKKAEEQQEGLQVELRILVEEKAETQEKLDELGNRRQPLAEGGTGLLDLPLGVKIPLLPGSKPVFCRTKLGEKLHQPSGYFNLGDPYCRLLSTEYNSLHDPHLQAYHKRKDNLQRLKREGYITSDGKVVCTLKELNEYRQYLTTLKVEAEKMFMREEASHCDQEAD
ncbi:fibrous sheath-interacting protein 2-like [Calonectris borealis]